MNSISRFIQIIFLGFILNVSMLYGKGHKLKKSDEENVIIKSQVGCYEVTSTFKEAGKVNDAYGVSSLDHSSKFYELVVLDSEVNDKISLQKIILTPFGPKKWMREEWERGPQKTIAYVAPNRWEQNPYFAKKSDWSLTVRNPDDSYQYQCAAPLTIVGGDFAHWECAANAPLPRREISQRTDYQILARKHFIVFSALGLIDRQSNRKVIYSGPEQQKNLAWEEGFVTYKKTNDQYCQEGKLWWNKQRELWKNVRDVWDLVFTNYYSVVLSDAVEGKTLPEEVQSIVTKNQALLVGVSDPIITQEAYKLMQIEVVETIKKYIKFVNEESAE